MVGCPSQTEVPLLVPPALPYLLDRSRRDIVVQPHWNETNAFSSQSGRRTSTGAFKSRKVPVIFNSSKDDTSGTGSSSTSQPSGRTTAGTSSLPVFRFGKASAIFAGGAFISAGGIVGGGFAHALSIWPVFRFFGKGEEEKEQKNVLIMMSNTGGGHRASAEALKAAFEELYGQRYKVHIADMWKEHTPAPFSNMPDAYSFMVKHGILWKMSYEFTNPHWIHIPYFRAIRLFIAKSLHRAFEQLQPDLVVSVHPLMQHIPIQILKQRIKNGLQDPLSFCTVVTDFTTCHNTWFHKEVSRCFVPTEYCANLAKKNGLKDDQIALHGLPIRPIFSKRLPPVKAIRHRLGLLPDKPAVLLVGGGEGMGKLAATVDQLADKIGADCQVVVICGRNKRLQADLEAKEYPEGMRVIACGFVDNIHEWMAACDVIITKAGPGTIAEALISGLPILLNGNIPCQEEGNIPYVVDNKVGAFETQPSKIADILKSWLTGPKEEFDGMAARSKALGRPDAVYDIVRELADLCDHPKPIAVSKLQLEAVPA